MELLIWSSLLSQPFSSFHQNFLAYSPWEASAQMWFSVSVKQTSSVTVETLMSTAILERKALNLTSTQPHESSGTLNIQQCFKQFLQYLKAIPSQQTLILTLVSSMSHECYPCKSSVILKGHYIIYYFNRSTLASKKIKDLWHSLQRLLFILNNQCWYVVKLRMQQWVATAVWSANKKVGWLKGNLLSGLTFEKVTWLLTVWTNVCS